MVVDSVESGGGYTWHSTLGPWRLDYSNRVASNGADDTDGSTIAFEARLSGPAAGVLEALVAPLSARGSARPVDEFGESREPADAPALAAG